MRTVLDLDGEDGSPFRLLDIMMGDTAVSDADKQTAQALFYGVMSSQAPFTELVRFFVEKMSKKYILDSRHPELLEIVTIRGEVLDKVIEDE